MHDSSSGEKRIQELHEAVDEQRRRDHDKKYFIGPKDVEVLLEENAEVIRCAREGVGGRYVLELKHEHRRYIYSSISPILVQVS